MNDNDAAELLDRLVADAPVGTAPTTELVRAGRARRRRTWAAGISVAAVAAVVGGLALAGTLGDGPGPGGETGVADDPTPSVNESETIAVVPGLTVPPAPDDPIYVQWTQREALPSCGVIEGTGKAILPQDEVDAGWRCLTAARDGAGGELAMAQNSVEGDPIRTWIRITPDGKYEVYYDATEDLFGSGAWDFHYCVIPKNLQNGCAG